MWTFLRNVEAVHEFVILLQNRFLPIPYLTDAERLAAVPVPGIPNFYRVSGRWGRLRALGLSTERWGRLRALGLNMERWGCLRAWG